MFLQRGRFDGWARKGGPSGGGPHVVALPTLVCPPGFISTSMLPNYED